MNNQNNKLYVGRTIILLSKLTLGLSLASIIYIFYKFISIADIKVTIAFFEAKFMGLFSNTYKVAYTNKHGIKVENYIPIFLTDPYVDYVLLKYKLALYNGMYLALFMSFMIIAMICYFRSKITAIIDEFKYQLLKEEQQVTKNNPGYLEPKAIIKKQDNDPIEYQDF